MITLNKIENPELTNGVTLAVLNFTDVDTDTLLRSQKRQELLGSIYVDVNPLLAIFTDSISTEDQIKMAEEILNKSDEELDVSYSDLFKELPSELDPNEDSTQLKKEIPETQIEERFTRINLDPVESSRTYTYIREGVKVTHTLNNVVALFKDNKGTSATDRLAIIDDKDEEVLVIVPTDYLSIEIKTDKFTL